MLSVRIGLLLGREKLATASPCATVFDASRLMLDNAASAVVVVEGDLLTGILTEHDVVFRVVATGRDPGAVRIDEVMTRAPITAGPEAALGHALALMHLHGCRHLPVVEAGRPIGIILARSALDPELEDFICEARRREAFSRSATAAGSSAAAST
ncbi:MAG: CBS domain-containing protein [Caldimonas sp.]